MWPCADADAAWPGWARSASQCNLLCRSLHHPRIAQRKGALVADSGRRGGGAVGLRPLADGQKAIQRRVTYFLFEVGSQSGFACRRVQPAAHSRLAEIFDARRTGMGRSKHAGTPANRGEKRWIAQSALHSRSCPTAKPWRKKKK